MVNARGVTTLQWRHVTRAQAQSARRSAWSDVSSPSTSWRTTYSAIARAKLRCQGERVKPNTLVNALSLDPEREPVPADQSVSGAPSTGTAELGEFGDRELGVWEMSPGVMTDVEADEVFVVLSGAATVEFDDGTAALQLGPGDVVRLAEGTHTVWTVTETLRKVYLT